MRAAANLRTSFIGAPAPRRVERGPLRPDVAVRGRVVWLFEEREGLEAGRWFGRYVLISFFGGTGFAALLVLSACLPEEAFAVRLGAMVWFFTFGVLRARTTLRPRPSSP